MLWPLSDEEKFTSSDNSNESGLADLSTSIIFICCTCWLAKVVRSLANFVLTCEQSFLSRLVNEFISSGELCATCFQVCLLGEKYGKCAYAATLFLLSLWWSTSWPHGTTASPLDLIEDWLQGNCHWISVVLITFFQMVAGRLAFGFYVIHIWKLKSFLINEEFSLDDECETDLQVHLLLGIFLEAFCAFVCQTTAKIIDEYEYQYGDFLMAFVDTTLVLMAYDYSGGYFNPMLATIFQYDCSGWNLYEHVAVYWFGSISGSVLSLLLWRNKAFQSYLQPKEINSLKKFV